MTEWRTPSGGADTMPTFARNEIILRRRQLLVHSAIYYVLDDNVIPDVTWQDWAFELASLQDNYGHRVGFYDKHFEDWDGSSGYFLPGVADPDVMRVAIRVLRYAKETT